MFAYAKLCTTFAPSLLDSISLKTFLNFLNEQKWSISPQKFKSLRMFRKAMNILTSF